MPPAPLIASVFVGSAGIVGLFHLAVHPEPFDGGRSLLIAAGMVLLTLVAMAGILLARGRWARWTGLSLGLGWLALAIRTDLTPLGASVIALAAATVALTAGPWLPRWLRHRPAADGPPPAAVILLLSLLAVPVAVGLSSEPVGAVEWVCSAWALAVAMGLARAMTPALWAIRLLHGPAMAACGIATGMPAAIWILLLGAAQVGIAWRTDVHLAVSPLVPQPTGATPMPPELVDPAILRAAGLDDRGRSMEDR